MATHFQNGDRVRWQGVHAFHPSGYEIHEGIITDSKAGGWWRMMDDEGNESSVHESYLTLIERPQSDPDNARAAAKVRLEVLVSCPECYDKGGEESCSLCDGEGVHAQAITLATAHFSEVAHALMEDTLIEAVFCHSTDDIRVIQANTRSELEGGTPAAE